MTCVLQTGLWSLDYAGITALIVSSFIPPIFYGFMCHPLLCNFYLYSTLSLGELQQVRQMHSYLRCYLEARDSERQYSCLAA